MTPHHLAWSAVSCWIGLSIPAAAAQAPDLVPNQVVVSGTVPDEATRSAILAHVRGLYGPERVLDQLGVGNVVAPPNWTRYVQKLISPQLKEVSHGQLSISGTNVDLRGEVSNEAFRQLIALEMSKDLHPTYVVKNTLRVAAREQDLLDSTLANRIIEFEQNSSTLLPAGKAILDEMAVTLLQLNKRKVEIIGHTDSRGNRESNMALSLVRADAVRNYLVSKGVSAGLLTISGAGPNRPVTTNSTAEGRARNRRIEFRLSES